MKANLLIVLNVFALLVALPALSAPNPKLTKEVEAKVNEAKRVVDAEIRSHPNHPFAGNYYWGDGHGANVNLQIAPTTWAFEWRGCMGVYDRNYGAVLATNGELQLSFMFTNSQQGFRGLDPVLIPVKWGERQYLIAPDKFVSFCNEVNSGDEPRKELHGQHLLRTGDEKKAVSGWPEIPTEFQKYLLKEPITARIIEVGKSKRSASLPSFMDTFVTLDAGTKQGLLTGMELKAIAPADLYESAVVSSASADKSIAVIQRYMPKTEIKTNWQFSTRGRQAVPAPKALRAKK